jgi:hypothetical protein
MLILLAHIISTDEDPGLRIESFVVINLCGVSTNKTIIYLIAMQTYKELIKSIPIVPNGKFKIAQKQLCEKALHALHKIRRKIDFHKLKPKTATKIFYSIISPILLYNSEVWGAYEKNDLNKWDNSETEKVHLRFCKLYLGVNSKQYGLQK